MARTYLDNLRIRRNKRRRGLDLRGWVQNHHWRDLVKRNWIFQVHIRRGIYSLLEPQPASDEGFGLTDSVI